MQGEHATATATSPPGAQRKRPTRLAVMCILLFIFEGLAILTSGYSVLYTGVQLLVGVSGNSGLPPSHPLRPVMEEFQQDVFWASMPYLQIPLQLAQAALSAVMIYAAFQAFRGRVQGRTLLATLTLVAAAFLSMKTLLGSVIQYRVYSVTLTMMQKLVESTPGTSAGRAEAAETMATVAMVTVVVMAVAVLVSFAVWLFLYLFTRSALFTADAREFFEPTPSPETFA